MFHYILAGLLAGNTADPVEQHHQSEQYCQYPVKKPGCFWFHVFVFIIVDRYN